MKGIIIINAVISFLVCGLCLTLYSMTTKKVVYVDVNQAVERAAVALAKTKLSQKMQEKIMKSYSSHLDKTIQEYGERNRVMIVVSSILTTGAQDVTNKIVKEGLKSEVNNV